MRPPLRPGDVVLGRPAGALRLFLFGARPAWASTRRSSAADFRTVWTAGSGWGTYAQKASAGKGLSLRLEAGAGAVELKDMVVTLPAEAEGKALRSIKGSLGGAAIVSTTRRTGNAVRIQWLKPVRVEPGRPLAVEIGF